MTKNILFFSKHCKYSKEILIMLEKTGILNTIIQVCIDDNNIQIPSFINVVPTLYLSETKNILTEDNLNSWIEKQSQNFNKEIDAYYSGDFSSSFSNLETNEDTSLSTNFTYLDQDISIKTTSEDPNVTKNNSLGSLEKQRQIDINNIFKK